MNHSTIESVLYVVLLLTSGCDVSGQRETISPTPVGPLPQAAEETGAGNIDSARETAAATDTVKVRGFVERMLGDVAGGLSELRRQTISKSAVSVAAAAYSDEVSRTGWIAVLPRHIPAKANQGGGLVAAPIDAKLARTIVKGCSLPEVSEADLKDDTSVLVISACYYGRLLRKYQQTGVVGHEAVGLAGAAYGRVTAAADLDKLPEFAMSMERLAGGSDHASADLRYMVLRGLEEVKSSLSPFRRELLATFLGHVGADTIDQDELRHYWAGLLAKEAHFDGTLRSPVGAVGIGQLMPEYRKDFGKGCGYPTPAEGDLFDDMTNATLSACYFRELHAAQIGTGETAKALPLALASYNAGQYSKSVASLRALSAMPNEPANYVAIIMVLVRVMREGIDVRDREKVVAVAALSAGEI